MHGLSIRPERVSTHSRAEAAADTPNAPANADCVSTHSRAEAAAVDIDAELEVLNSFNTQPRGGGCFFILGWISRY